MIKRTKYSITIDAVREEYALSAGFKYSEAANILWLGYDDNVGTSLELDYILGEDYGYILPRGNIIDFDAPETIIKALNLFLVNLVENYVGGYLEDC